MRILLLLALTGCASTRDYTQVTKQVAEYGIQSIKVGKATCFVYRDDDGSSMSCIP